MSAMVVSYRLSIVTVALSVTVRPQFAIECLRRSNQQCEVTMCGKIWKERVDQRKPNFNTMCERHMAVVYKRNLVDNFSRLSTMHEGDRQSDTCKRTDTLRNGKIDPNRRNCLVFTREY